MKVKLASGGYVSIDRIVTPEGVELVEVAVMINEISGTKAIIDPNEALAIAHDINNWFYDTKIEPDTQDETVLQSEK